VLKSPFINFDVSDEVLALLESFGDFDPDCSKGDKGIGDVDIFVGPPSEFAAKRLRSILF